MPELKDYTIGTLTITILMMLGYNIAVDDTHFCRELEMSKPCDRLSGSGNTCYPNPGTRLGSKFCSTGWEAFSQIKKEPVIPGLDLPLPGPKNISLREDLFIKCNGKVWQIEDTPVLSPYTRTRAGDLEGYLGECI